MPIGTHLDLPAEVQAAIQNAIAVVDAHMAALNARAPADRRPTSLRV